MNYETENGFVLSYTAEEGEKAAVLPEGVIGIGQRAFADAPLERIDLPDGLQKIEAEAFSGCFALTELKLPASVNSISTGAFSGCASLARVWLPEGLGAYGEHIFSACPVLRRVDGLESGSWCEYDPKAALLSLHQRGGYVGALPAGCFVDSALLRGGTVLEALDDAGARQWALWLPAGESSADLKEGIRDLLYSASSVRFSAYDDLYRCVKDPKNRLLFAIYRLLYPVDMAPEVSIMLRNQLRRGASECVCALIEDGRMAELRAAAQAGFLDRAKLEDILPCAAQHGCEAEVRALFENKSAENDQFQSLNAAQVRMLNKPVYERLMKRQEKMRRASLERLAQREGGLEQLLREAVLSDDRNRVRFYLSSSFIDAKVLFDCAGLAVKSGDIFMLQDLIEGMHGLDGEKAGLLLEQAAIAGKTDVVKYLCSSLDAITPYNRALGYALRQADFAMAHAILSRDDQRLKTARDIREEFVQRMNKPSQAELSRLVIDLIFVEYSYFDDDFRYFFLNNGRNGLVGDEFYDTHYTLVRLAGVEERIAFIHKMAEAGHFTKKHLDYLCYLATDADEIPIAQDLVNMGADFDVKECSIIANQQTILEYLGDLFTSNPRRPSDEKFAFIISRLKPGETLKMQVKYLLKTANVRRALAILKHSSLADCEDVHLTIEYFVEHNSLEAIELLCSWGKADECFEVARAHENTEIVAWILNYQNAHVGHTEVEDRFEI